jgi:hypothetical protein
MNIFQLSNIICDEERALRWARENGLLSPAPNCSLCPRQMTLVKIGRGDQRMWRCPSHKHVKKSVMKKLVPLTAQNSPLEEIGKF